MKSPNYVAQEPGDTAENEAGRLREREAALARLVAAFIAANERRKCRDAIDAQPVLDGCARGTGDKQ
jgi:hypothetical protein